MTYRVQISPRAYQDASKTFRWLADRSPPGADRWYAAFLAAAADLDKEPESRGLAADCEGFDYEVREQYFRTRRGKWYRVLFAVVGEEVQVLRVWAPGQAPVRREDLPADLDG